MLSPVHCGTTDPTDPPRGDEPVRSLGCDHGSADPHLHPHRGWRADPVVRHVADGQDRSASRGVRRRGRGELGDRGRAGRRRAAGRDPRHAAASSRTSCSTLVPTCPIHCACPVRMTRPPCGSWRRASIGWSTGATSSAIRCRPSNPSSCPAGRWRRPSCTSPVRSPGGPSGPPGWLPTEYGTEPVADPETPGGVNPLAITYLNRLSDLLFILTRAVNGADGDVLWVPGRDREPDSRS